MELVVMQNISSGYHIAKGANSTDALPDSKFDTEHD